MQRLTIESVKFYEPLIGWNNTVLVRIGGDTIVFIGRVWSDLPYLG